MKPCLPFANTVPARHALTSTAHLWPPPAPPAGLAEHVVYVGIATPSHRHQPVKVDPETGAVGCALVGANPDIDIQVMPIDGAEDDELPEGVMPVAPGATGEIWVHSPSVAAGYWGRPDLTARTFHNTWQGRRYLRTG